MKTGKNPQKSMCKHCEHFVMRHSLQHHAYLAYCDSSTCKRKQKEGEKKDERLAVIQ